MNRLSGPGVLLVTADSSLTQRFARELLRRLSIYPVVATSGEAAVKRVAEAPVGVCVLNYRLPGIDGLETLLQLRQRAPNLPVVMVSNARSEAVAVAAFRLGVTDYFPEARGFEVAVVERVSGLMPAPVAERANLADAAVDPNIPAELLNPTYQNRLRLIGRQLDLYGARDVTIIEVKGGLLVRWFPENGKLLEPLEFTEADFPVLAKVAYEARDRRSAHADTRSSLLPTGYEDFLRALGHWFDGRRASAVQVVELDDLVVISAIVPSARSAGMAHESAQIFLGPADIQQLLEDAFRRRRTTTRPPSRVPGLLGRRLG